MVFERSQDQNEQQVHRHGGSHLPTGQDPAFPFGNNGQILIYVNGVLTPVTPSGGSPAIPGPLVVYIPMGSQMANGMTYAP